MKKNFKHEFHQYAGNERGETKAKIFKQNFKTGLENNDSIKFGRWFYDFIFFCQKRLFQL